jgi:anaerobic magnesium-protoporphyrin IX monomethyl ester cyclase
MRNGWISQRVQSLSGEELNYLKSQYQVEGIYFADATFTAADRSRTIELCRVLEKIELRWCCETRIDCLGDQLLLQMKKGGCRGIVLGIESANQGILDTTKKGISVRQIREVIQNIRKVGITPFAFVLFGLPGETEQTIRETLSLIEELRIWSAPNLLFPIPGTPLYEQVKNDGKMPPLSEFLMRLSRYHISNRVEPTLNLSEVSDEALGEAIKETRRLNRYADIG